MTNDREALELWNMLSLPFLENGDVFGWGNNEYSQFDIVTKEFQVRSKNFHQVFQSEGSL
jgi:hypothetical protein